MSILKNKTMTGTHTIQEITFDSNNMSLKVDGKLVVIPLVNVSSRLQSANDVQRNFFIISPSGYGIHWPLIDEDLSVDAILKKQVH
jgi:Protein of unknown function (DUF2442)